MKIDDAKIKEILLKQNFVTEDDLQKADTFVEEKKGSITDYLLAEDLITKDLLGQAIAEMFEISYADLNSHPPGREQVLKIPEKVAKSHRVVIFREDDKSVVLATDNPLRAGTFFAEVKKLFEGKDVSFAYSLTEDIEASFLHYRKALETRFSEIISKQKRVAPEIINEILNDALLYKASDVHFEPQEKEVVVRFRIDGILQEAGRISKEHYESILNRIKVQSHLRLDEHFAAQDGSFRYLYKGRPIDMRVSVAPLLDGEKVAIRMLSEYISGYDLSDLGLSSSDEELVAKAAKNPFGMIIVTGPTGSGKTTTLYALLKMLNRPEVNITTIEDPVEYKVVGLNQIQVNTQTNLTFAKGLRSIVRQDPDIILVGEIRDIETAEIAVNAALTGHLLLSTFHANDAATSVPRLLDMEVEPFLLASTLELIVAQRLVRRICENCRVSYTAKKADIEKDHPLAVEYLPDESTTLYKGKGCKVCNNTGYKGRTAIFEFIDVNREMATLILQNPSAKEVYDVARKSGMKTMFEDGIDKVKNGVTTLEELYRVAKPPENNNHSDKNTKK